MASWIWLHCGNSVWRLSCAFKLQHWYLLPLWSSGLNHTLMDHRAFHHLLLNTTLADPSVRKFISSLWKVGDFLQGLWFPAPFKSWLPWYKWKILTQLIQNVQFFENSILCLHELEKPINWINSLGYVSRYKSRYKHNDSDNKALWLLPITCYPRSVLWLQDYIFIFRKEWV